LYGMAVRFCGNEMDAQDALQEMWIRACRNMANFKWESAFRTWATGILINCARELSRKHGRLREGSEDELNPELVSEVSNIALSLENAIAQLPDGYRHVLVLHDVEGYTHGEITALLCITAGTSKSQLHRARRALRNLYLARAET
jgi:RNA polymerase sigma-70 factor, ECF subfamily